MKRDIIAGWRASLNGSLHGRGGQQDKEVIEAISQLEDTLTAFVRSTILKDIKLFFPNATAGSTAEVIRSIKGEFILEPINRSPGAKRILSVIVLDKNQQLFADVKDEFDGFPIFSGIEKCEVRCAPGVVIDREMIRVLVRTSFNVGYDWAIQMLSNLVGRRFDRVGQDFYDMLAVQLKSISDEARRAVILVAYYRGTEFCVLSKSFAEEHARSFVTQLSLAPKNNVPAFAKYLISYVRGRHTPFHEALQTGKSITINLKGTSSEYYNEDEEFLRLMISIYGSSVVVLPLVACHEITLGCNFRPQDKKVVEPELLALTVEFSKLLENNYRHVRDSLKLLETMAVNIRSHRQSWLSERRKGIIMHSPELVEIFADFIHGVAHTISTLPTILH